VATNYDVDSPDGHGLRGTTLTACGSSRATSPSSSQSGFFAAHENRTGNRNNGHLMTVANASGACPLVAAAARQQLRGSRKIVGSHWFQYYDHPRGGRLDGEDYNFGLVDIDDRPYEELVAALSRVTPGLAAIHQEAQLASPALPGAPQEIPEADIDPHDRSCASGRRSRR